MKEPALSFEEIQDAHLDMLLTLAFEQEQLEEAQEILRQAEETPEDEALQKETLRLLNQKADKLAQAEKRQARKQRIRRYVPRIMEIAACVVLVFGIASPVAIANVASIRAKVMKLLVEMDTQAGVINVQFGEDTQAGFDVPSGYLGSYYPSDLPEDMVLSECGKQDAFVSYTSPQNKTLSFAEYDQATALSAGIEGGYVTCTTFSGGLAYITQATINNEALVRVLWANDTNWFMLQTTNMTREETLQIASSVKKIIP